MPKPAKAYQIATFADDKTARWSVENIDVELDKATGIFTYRLLEYNEGTKDWEDSEITKQQAEDLCLVTLPNVFYY